MYDAAEESVARACMAATVCAAPDVARVLDLGDTSGVFAHEFVVHDRNVTLVDDAETVGVVRPLLSRANVDLTAGDPADLPISEAKLVSADDTFAGHDPDDVWVLVAGVFNALEPGDTVVFVDSLYGRCSTDVTAGWTVNALVVGRGDLHDEETIRSWVESAGFDGCTVRGVSGTDLRAVISERAVGQDRPPRSAMDNSMPRDDIISGLERSLELLPGVVSIAMRGVPRYEFITDSPYQNCPTERRDTNMTIPAPTMVTHLLAVLDPQPDDEVLVVGMSVGYTAAVLVEIADDAHVHAVDITRSPVYETRENLQRVGYGNILVDCRDGTEGLTDYAPLDRIPAEASAVRLPVRFLVQFVGGGRLVIPKGVGEQALIAVEDGEVAEPFDPLPFKPLPVGGEQTGNIVGN